MVSGRVVFRRKIACPEQTEGYRGLTIHREEKAVGKADR